MLVCDLWSAIVAFPGQTPSCADPESFVRGGPTQKTFYFFLFFFFFLRGWGCECVF